METRAALTGARVFPEVASHRMGDFLDLELFLLVEGSLSPLEKPALQNADDLIQKRARFRFLVAELVVCFVDEVDR